MKVEWSTVQTDHKLLNKNAKFTISSQNKIIQQIKIIALILSKAICRAQIILL